MLAMAIKLYEGAYNRYPSSVAAEKASANTDFTFGTRGIMLSPGGSPVETGLAYETNNSELVVILLGVNWAANPNHLSRNDSD